MNIKKITPQKLAFIKNALRMNVPLVIIAKVCEVSTATIFKYTKGLRKDRVKELSRNDLWVEMLKFYAWSIADPKDFDLAIGQQKKMANALYNYLKLDIWIHYLNGILSVVNSFTSWSFEDDIPENHRVFFLAICAEERGKTKASSLIEKIVRTMHATHTYPSATHAFIPSKALEPFIDEFVREEKERTKFLITKECMNFLMNTIVPQMSPKNRDIIVLSFGLEDELPMEIPAVANRLRKSVNMVTNEKKRILRVLNSGLTNSGYFPNWNKVFKTMVAHCQVIEKLTEKVNRNDLETAALALPQHIKSDLDVCYLHNISLEQLKFLQRRLLDVDLSVRSYNCLKAYDIRRVWEILKYNRIELRKFRNFGKHSLREIEMLFEKQKIPFAPLDYAFTMYLEKSSN
jgi:hypothetical protein